LHGWGTRTNTQLALYYLKLASECGDKEAAAQLGFIHEKGFGVKKSKIRAAKYYRLSEPDNKDSWFWASKYNTRVESQVHVDQDLLTKLKRRPPKRTFCCACINNYWF
jgi:TPR repeat protein